MKDMNIDDIFADPFIDKYFNLVLQHFENKEEVHIGISSLRHPLLVSSRTHEFTKEVKKDYLKISLCDFLISHGKVMSWHFHKKIGQFY